MQEKNKKNGNDAKMAQVFQKKSKIQLPGVVTGVIILLFVLTGCIQIDYQGESLKELPEDARIGVYYNPDKLPLPVGKMKKVGTLSATASTSSNTVNDMRNKIMKCARNHGANVILFTSVEYTPDGEARPDQIQNIASPGWDRVDNTQSNVRQEWSAFLYTGAKEPDIAIYTVKMKAELFLAPAHLLKGKDVPQKRTPSFPVPEKKELRINVK